MANRERDFNLKSKQRKQQSKKLKLGHVPGVKHFKVAAEIRNASPLCDLPKEILVDIFKHTGIVGHVILSLCSKQLSRVPQDLTGAVVLPRRGSLNYQTYKEYVEILVRLVALLPIGYKICSYCELHVRWTDKWDKQPPRKIKLWESAPSKSIRADYCQRCTAESRKTESG